MSLDSLGRYEILEELGRGAMGVVYKARDPLIDRTVAIKTVDLDSSSDRPEAFERRFYREAKSAGQLNHLNIVTIHDVGRSGGSAYIAMEFLEGKSLREIIDSGVVLPPEKIAEIVAQAAEGLACAHKNHVIHRDIKPANIMLLDSGTVKITDFGIALLSKGSLTLGSVFGSPKYISPEQVVGQQADARSDIFSLGAVLYELLTGSPAFTASDLDAVLCQVINEMPAAPSTRNRNIAPGFDRITARAMAKHPDDRYPSAQEMADDLRNFQDLEAPADVQVSQRTLERRLRRREAAGTQFGAEAADRQVERFSSPVANAVWRRRNMIVIGVPVALLVVAAAWALAPKRLPKQEQPVMRVAALAPLPAAATNPGDAPLRAAAREASSSSIPVVAVSNTPPAPAPAARLAFAVSPWGEVYVDGRRRGISPPLQEIKLSPGKHVVEIRNTTFQRHSQTVDLDADASVRIKHKFQ
ncbi:MAG TPA: serine/threonine-protein kinase [Casimicrobiaceae bacterium]|nr:serine/threonine-protein kinase [Casimicrobiaceae bacterium]